MTVTKLLALGATAATLSMPRASSIAQDRLDKQYVPANLLIPQPPPSAPLADWVDTPIHARLTESLSNATLRGWDYKPDARTKASTPVILFFNGNGMTIDRSNGLYRQLADLGAEVCVYDYRGIGFSEGQPDVLTFRQDSLHLYDAVAAAHAGHPVIVYGFSLGTAMATYVASQRKLAGLILAGTIASAGEEFPVYLHAGGVSPEIVSHLTPAPDSVEAFDEVGNIAHSTAPLLMLHGEDDRLVPIAQGRKVFVASKSTEKRFVPLPGTGHNETAGTSAGIDAVGTFLKKF